VQQRRDPVRLRRCLWQHHVNDWRWAVDVNVFGVIGINTFVPVLLEQGARPRRQHVVVERHVRR
jgi:hypothetical protein